MDASTDDPSGNVLAGSIGGPEWIVMAFMIVCVMAAIAIPLHVKRRRRN
ncbi:hypothetical protein [Embleya sp. NPDC050493]